MLLTHGFLIPELQDVLGVDLEHSFKFPVELGICFLYCLVHRLLKRLLSLLFISGLLVKFEVNSSTSIILTALLGEEQET